MDAVAIAPVWLFLNRRLPPCFRHRRLLLYNPIPKCSAFSSSFPKGFGPLSSNPAGNPGPSSITERNKVFSARERAISNFFPAKRAAFPIRFSATFRNIPWSVRSRLPTLPLSVRARQMTEAAALPHYLTPQVHGSISEAR